MSLPLVLITILVCGIACQWLAWRFRIPAIVLLTTVGLLLGPIGGLVNPAEQFGKGFSGIVPLFVAIILFEGGLNLRLHEFREAAIVVRRLATLGILAAWILGSAAAHWIGGFSWAVASVLGAILVVTGPTVIMPLLKHARLNRRTASYLKWEGIINDPLGVLLAVIVFQYWVYAGGRSLTEVLFSLGIALVVATAIGGGLGWLLGYCFRRGWVPEYLKAPVIIAGVLGIYGLADFVEHESGLLSATVMGIVMGNMGLRSIDEMRRFKEYVGILLVSFLFVSLTASLDPELLTTVTWRIVPMVVAFLLVVRPLSVFLATVRSDARWQERALISWIAPRGVVAAATAAAFAPEMIAAGYADATALVPAVFLVIMVTVVLHGFTLAPLAGLLKLGASGPGRVLVVGASPWAVELCATLKSLEVDVLLADSDWSRLRNARQRGVPTWFGEILSEQAEEALELDDVKLVLAATSNAAYNALVCNNYAPEIGRNKVFQLVDAGAEKPARAVSHTVRGVTAFAEPRSFAELWTLLIRGWEFQKTRVTEEFDAEAALAQLPEEAMLVAVKSREGKLRWIGADKPKLAVGEVLVSFVPPADARTPDEASAPSGDALPA